MIIRECKPEDLTSIQKISSLSLKSFLPLEYFKRNLTNILVAIENGINVGFIVFKNGNILNIAVHPDFRRRGIGKSLIKEVMRRFDRVRLRVRESNKDAINFLEKLGFKKKRIIKEYYSNKENAIEWELAIQHKFQAFQT
jgi:ribosomal-protein-alanine N-acetyltransferase